MKLVLALAVLFVLIFAAAPASAQVCQKCFLPPPWVAFFCGETEYNSAEQCEILDGGTRCRLTGSCAGRLGNCNLECAQNQDWTLLRCNDEPIRLVSVETKKPARRRQFRRLPV
jgi:hypothetical protein